MKIIRERGEVLKSLQVAGSSGRPILCPNAETPEEMEGILLGANRHAEMGNSSRVVIGIGVTASYPGHPQLGNLSSGEGWGPGALNMAAQTWLGWLEGYANRDGLFDQVDVIPFLDHGWAPLEADQSLMGSRWFQDAMGIVMFDASKYDFEENVRRTAEFVASAGEHVVLEACPDKVYEREEIERGQLSETSLLSDPSRVSDFVRLTGVDLIVPNLGTEHRTTSDVPLEYRRDLAQAICAQVGPILALHGTSSLGGRLQTVGSDGICKVNFYTAMARGASMQVKAAWDQISYNEGLRISLACGSSIHVTRRNAFADRTKDMLNFLHISGDS